MVCCLIRRDRSRASEPYHKLEEHVEADAASPVFLRYGGSLTNVPERAVQQVGTDLCLAIGAESEDLVSSDTIVLLNLSRLLRVLELDTLLDAEAPAMDFPLMPKIK